MNENVTKEDLRQFGLLLMNNISTIIMKSRTAESKTLDPNWIKSRAVRKMLDISAGSIQNLRMTQKVRFKKVLGSYYYNKEDLLKLFDNEKKQ